MQRLTERVYLAFPRETDKVPRLKHGRSSDDKTPMRERIRRPIHSMPRRASDWQ